MDAESLRTFLTVARTRSISKAATQLFATQPTVSQRIKRLETELGFEVLKRSWRGVELTAQGRHLLPTIAEYLISLETARALLLTDDADTAVSSIARWHAGPLMVGMDEWLVGRHHDALLDQLAERSLEVSLTVASAPRIQAMVLHDVAPLGIQYAPEDTSDGPIHSSVLWDEPLALVYPSGDRAPDGWTGEDLHHFFQDKSFMLMDEPIYTLHSAVTAPFLDTIRPASIRVVDNIEVLASLCRRPRHATVLPAGMLLRRPSLADDRLDHRILSPSFGQIPVRLAVNRPVPEEKLDAVSAAVVAWGRHVGAEVRESFAPDLSPQHPEQP
ncbi:LysR family transcriptional regulator [Citricoccus sp. GCM10030269]|uniref:LysR family transcriptional regulator n=1 Tax=Citricoccus sp. GCM10030269 TaxID=3273388 RepID=UPI003605B2D8